MDFARLILILLGAIACVQGQKFIGYDCGSRSLNVTTLSLLDVEDCEIPNDNVAVEETYVQLLQLNDYTETRAFQCKVEVIRSVYHCGMFSHVSIVTGGEGEYIQELGVEACREMHLTGLYRLSPGHSVRGLRVNQTTVHSVTFAGKVNNEGKCDGVSYSDPLGTWDDVVVIGKVRITLWQQTARVMLNNNRLILSSGTTCALNEGSCMDMAGGETFWAPIPIDQCGFSRYGLLYEGLASKMTDHAYDDTQVVYSLSTQDVMFALTAKGRDNVCGYNVIRTEHPKLVLLETTKGRTFTSNTRMSVDNLDIFAYVNSKFVYVEKHVRTQMKNLYRDALLQRCNLERQSLKNSLSIATNNPDEFAYHLMKGPGYMAVVAGEVVHIIKCLPVEVALEHGDYCYSELQVTRNNETYFLSPRTHILKTKGNQINCNALIPAYYLIGETWLKIMPRPIEAKDPTVMKPMTKTTWKYVNPEHLATSGIYTEKDIKDLRDRIMFPVERTAILNDVAREMRGHPIADHEGSIFKLLNEGAVMKIGLSAWDKLCERFMKFGTISAGIIAIVFIFYIFKSVVDVIMRGITLYSIFGWSFHLLGALWSSIGHCLIYSAQGTERGQSGPPGQSSVSADNAASDPKNLYYPPLNQIHVTEPTEESLMMKEQNTKRTPTYNLLPKVR